MKKVIIFLLLPLFSWAQKQPKLIVGIVADQMRYEMLERFRSDFGPDGFNLLVEEGMKYDSCTFSYIPTYTAPGHATIYTGVKPSQHGILANNIYIPELGKSRYCVVDEDVMPIGTVDQNCKRSPKHLHAPTLGDSLKIADGKSRVVAVSIKDRGAVLPAGENGEAYWMDDDGMMVTSSYYKDALPRWVDSFNTKGYTAHNALSKWEYFQDISEYDESLPDDSPFESKQFDDTNVLPYNISHAIHEKGLGVLRNTPYGNSLLTEFAIWALRSEHLGRDKHTDLLAISYSSTDYIGHDYGPQSVEVQDAYLRLDRDLAYLINMLDTEIGRKNYVVFLTSDHGAANTPSDTGFSYESTSKLKNELNIFTQRAYGVKAVKHISCQQIWLDHSALDSLEADKLEIRHALIAYMLSTDQDTWPFMEVYSKDQIANCKRSDCMPFTNAFIPALSGDIFYIRPHGQIERSVQFGTTHGSGHLYDTHVPLLFFGGNVSKGSNQESVSVSDIRKLLKMYLPHWQN